MYTSILFVCTGNICRSPTADGMLQHLLQENGIDHINIDSAGISAWHQGHAPDIRAVQAAKARGYDISHIRARALTQDDFNEFDLIVAMDNGHYDALMRMKPNTSNVEIKMHSDFAKNPAWKDVPDPYYGGEEYFNMAFDLIENGVHGILTTLIEESPPK